MAYNYEYPYTDPDQYNDDWLINKVKQLSREWDEMKIKFNTLEEYVKNYFANLNLQEEVNAKIDQMISSGQMNELLSVVNGPLQASNNWCLIFGGNSWINSITEEGAKVCRSLLSNLGYFMRADLQKAGSTLLGAGSLSYEFIARDYFQKNPTAKINAALVFLESTDKPGPNFVATVTALGNYLMSVGAKRVFIFPPLTTNYRVTEEDIGKNYLVQGNYIGTCDSILLPIEPYTTTKEWLSNGSLTTEGCRVYKNKVVRAFGLPTGGNLNYVHEITGDDGRSVLAIRIVHLKNRMYCFNCEIRAYSLVVNFETNIYSGSGNAPCSALISGGVVGSIQTSGGSSVLKFECSGLPSSLPGIFNGNLIVSM